MIRTALAATLALPLLAAAGQSPTNLPGAEPAPAPIGIAEQNRRAAALRSTYEQERAAYEAALAKNRAAQDMAAAAQADYRRRMADFAAAPARPAPASAPRSAPAPAASTCVRRAAIPVTGSHIAGQPSRRVCPPRPITAAAVPMVGREDRDGIEAAIEGIQPRS